MRLAAKWFRRPLASPLFLVSWNLRAGDGRIGLGHGSSDVDALADQWRLILSERKVSQKIARQTIFARRESGELSGPTGQMILTKSAPALFGFK